jgi:hypothetical protein
MLVLNERYRVHDREGRIWGSVEFRHSHGHAMSGPLEPTVEFQQVRELLRTWDHALHTGDQDLARSVSQEILLLAPVVHCERDGGTAQLDSVYVSEENMFTCSENMTLHLELTRSV